MAHVEITNPKFSTTTTNQKDNRSSSKPNNQNTNHWSTAKKANNQIKSEPPAQKSENWLPASKLNYPIIPKPAPCQITVSCNTQDHHEYQRPLSKHQSVTCFPTSTCLKFKQQYPERNTFLTDDRLTGLHLANEGPKLGHKELYFSPLTRRRMHLWRRLMCEDPTLPSGGALCTKNDHLLKRSGEFFGERMVHVSRRCPSRCMGLKLGHENSWG